MIRIKLITKCLLVLAFASISLAYPIYKQCDEEWANIPFGPTGTICSDVTYGSQLTSLSNFLVRQGVLLDGEIPNPKTQSEYIKEHWRSTSYFSSVGYNWLSLYRQGITFGGWVLSYNNEIEHVAYPGSLLLLKDEDSEVFSLFQENLGENYSVLDPTTGTEIIVPKTNFIQGIWGKFYPPESKTQ